MKRVRVHEHLFLFSDNGEVKDSSVLAATVNVISPRYSGSGVPWEGKMRPFRREVP